MVRWGMMGSMESIALAVADIAGYWEERQRKLETQQVDARLFGSVTNCLGAEADRWWSLGYPIYIIN